MVLSGTGVIPGMEAGGLVVTAGLGGPGVGVAAAVDGAVVVGRGAISSLAGAGLVAGAGVDFEAGDWEAAGFDAGGLEAGDVDGATDGCPAAILHAASDSATKQTGRSTRFM
jgi:hypothetical protein